MRVIRQISGVGSTLSCCGRCAKGVCLDQRLTDPDEAEPTRLLREDISDGDIEAIYRQFANFQIQLFGLDFNSIDSLPGDALPKRPLTFKAHDILQNGGVDVFGAVCCLRVPSCSTVSPASPN